jgi:hypothetical protein
MAGRTMLWGAALDKPVLQRKAEKNEGLERFKHYGQHGGESAGSQY